jgi:DNA-binding response OmpR family regulator
MNLLKRQAYRNRNLVAMPRTEINPKEDLDPSMSDTKLILSVDDEALILHTRQKILEAAGYDVLSASDGEQALGFFAAVLVDLVVLDHAMPGINGGRVAQEMKACRPKLPIILVTGLPLEEETLPGVDWVYRKGEDPALLLAKIRELLARPSTAREERANPTGEAALEVLGVFRPLVADGVFEAQNKLYEDESETRLHFAKLVLIEAVVHGICDLKLDDFGQETSEYGNQVAYSGTLLSSDGNKVLMRGNSSVSGNPPLRCAFYLHYYDQQYPLRWTHGEVPCPPVEEVPERLLKLVPYSPVE